MDEKQAAERDLLLQRAEIEARLRALTEERKAELRRSGPLSEDAASDSTGNTARSAAAEQHRDPPASAQAAVTVEPAEVPVEPAEISVEPTEVPQATDVVQAQEALLVRDAAQAVEPAEPFPAASPVLVPTPAAEAVAARSAAPAATPEAGVRAPYAPAPAGEAVANERKSGRGTTAVIRVARHALGKAKALPAALRALSHALRSRTDRPGTGRQTTASRAAEPKGVRVGDATPAEPQVVRVGDAVPAEPPLIEPAADREQTGRRRRRSRIPLAVAAGVALALGGFAAIRIADIPIPRFADGFLPAAETPDAGSSGDQGGRPRQSQDAARPANGAETGDAAGAGPTAATTTAPTASAQASLRPDPGADSWSPPVLPEISDPETAEGGGGSVDLELDLTAPATSRPDPAADLAPVPAGVTPERPGFISYEVAPRLLNAAEIQRLLERSYPAALRSAGIEGSVILRVFIDEQGAVQSTDVTESSGYPSMDEAALTAADRMQFSPAMNRDKPIAVWLALPIQFR